MVLVFEICPSTRFDVRSFEDGSKASLPPDPALSPSLYLSPLSSHSVSPPNPKAVVNIHYVESLRQTDRVIFPPVQVLPAQMALYGGTFNGVVEKI